ncbi:hypothetical protein B0H66DRAFT_597064 [Apodospora peruviana]|uniref:G-patch domain-containing protein n=1 Tax=Apodospora peruviana TaxID=516989 RepID=A0AAE0IQV2_9PEZI|nr:hypothetical protein B0H66DRAFT_597064 [Apodospora peruviana]
MDASALLKAQGWRGKGFSLHPTDNSIGLAKPLLMKRNADGRGVGQKPHHTSDQWWLHAFDEKLKGLDTSKMGTVTQSVKQGRLDVVVATGKKGKYTGASGLYASFVSGGLLVGTEIVEQASTTDTTPVSSSGDDSSSSSGLKKKKRSSSSSSREGETKAERRVRREARRLRKAHKAAKKAAAEARLQKERRKLERATRKEAKSARRVATVETKEERRARKAERRARKEARRKRRGGEESPAG